MKKFFIGLLSIFLLFGANILSACTTNGTNLILSKDMVEIQIHTDEDENYEIVTAEVEGTDKASIFATAKSGFENIIKVTTSKISDTKVSIKIEGLNEGDAQIQVKSGSKTKYIHASVYSEVSEMSQKVEDGVKNNFLVRGQENILNENNLLNFAPSSKSRRTISWSLTDPLQGVTLEGTSLTIADAFIGDYISLTATTEKDISTVVVLPVLDKINNETSLSFSYSKTSSFEVIDDENNTFNIVPNLSSDAKYQGYILLDYTGELGISGYALDSTGKVTEDIVVNRDGDLNGYPVFTVFANKEKTNINSDYKIGFKIGYKEYNYAFDTIESTPITIKARELISGIILSTNDSQNIENSTQTLYTEYAESENSTAYGQIFNVRMIPTTVLDATNKYLIGFQITELGEALTDDGSCPIEIWYRDANGNVWTQINLVYDSLTGLYKTNEENLPNASTLYIKATEKLKVQSATGLRLTFTSADNRDISTSFNLKLVRSVSSGDFEFPNGDLMIDSSEANITYTKQFTLKGQTSVEGLYVINNSKNVVDSGIEYVSNDEESITFKVTFTLKKASLGVTTTDYYQIAHKNGLTSKEMKIDIFLPLKEVGMFVDQANNKSNSVLDTNLNDNTYNYQGNLLDLSCESLSGLMLKNNTTTPVVYSYNKINNISAVANIKVEYFDFSNIDYTLEEYLALIENPEDIVKIIEKANGNTLSSIAYFTSDYSSIVTKGVGYTYAVISFTGKGAENSEFIDVEGNVTFVKILKIESLITPESMNIVPDSDKLVNLYSMESLATSDENLTNKDITIKFTKTDVTYQEIYNLTFYSRNEEMGSISRSSDGSTVSWSEGRYTVSNIKLLSDGISFTIGALHTYGEYIFTDTLDIHYVIYNQEDKKVYDISSSIKITINNAQRIESLIWDNYDENGLYFEKGDQSVQYILLNSTPTNAKNKNIAYVLTDKEGASGTTFVSVSDSISSDILAVNLATDIGMTGYIYILPADAIYNNQIKYYYIENKIERTGYINPNSLGLVIDEKGQTNYDYLVKNAYFKSNVQNGESKNVDFSEIILKIKITVADGNNFDHAYRIFDETGFNSIQPDKYYTVMSSLEIPSSRIALETFNGGLQGFNNDVTVQFNGANFANVIGENAEIRNIKFNGTVSANGFIANVNNGKLTNVTVDVNGIKASMLESKDNQGYVGGLVGINNAYISGSKVLGLNIDSKNSTIGGIAGQNNGTITYCAVEFYNLLIDQENKIYGSNKFDGYNVGALVGEIRDNSTISYTYAYDYTLSKESENVIIATNNKGSFAGSLVVSTTATIDQSFAVVGQSNTYGGSLNTKLILSNYYNAYYLTGEYKVDYSADYTTDPDFVQTSSPEFDKDINTDGKNSFSYLKAIQQNKEVSSVAYNFTTVSENGYYKSLKVDEKNGILFYYALQNNFVELNTAEQNDLTALNTITLSKLVGNENVGENIIITSSDWSKIKVVGTTLLIRKTGEVQLTLSSKHNVELNKTIKVKIISPLSKLAISWIDGANKTNFVEENSQLSLQKTRSRDFSISFNRTKVYLGKLASTYDLIENEYSLNISTDITENNVEYQIISKKEFKLLSQESSKLTEFTIIPNIFNNDETFQNAINLEFKRMFKVLPTEGLISFEITDDSITISPSINSSIKAKIQTTAESDTIYPIIKLKEHKLAISNPEPNLYNFAFAGESQPIIEVLVLPVGEPITKNGVTTYTFDINFAIADEYRVKIADEYVFDVSLISQSGNSSEEWGGTFKLFLKPQEITNIDISNRKIQNPSYRLDGESYVETYIVEKETAVLAPGNSSILEINVNPKYAYYDYVAITYGGATISNAVNIVVVEPFNDSVSEFKKKTIENGNIETGNNTLIYRPSINATAEEKSTIYYKLWINSAVNKDSTICITATFYKNNGEKIDYVNYFITVSYLSEPNITIDGTSTTYLAKGSTADVKIEVLIDQKVDSLIIEGENVEGVSVSQLSKPDPDYERGINIYTAKVYATVLAKTSAKDTFYLKARVSRNINGSKEIKEAIATIVLVDFKIDSKTITIQNSDNNNFTIWQGVSKPFMVDYDILPESYPYPSTTEISNAIKELRAKRNIFDKHEVYPIVDKDGDTIIDNEVLESDMDSNYIVNYIYNDENDTYIKQSLYDRLFVIVNNQPVHISDTSVEKPFTVNVANDGTVSFIGTKASSKVNMVLKTYITAGFTTSTIDTPFVITVDTFSDPDLPIKISNATEFNNLNPAKLSQNAQKVKNDYILENDIVLENYTSFNTDLISSFDGNGHTIYIKSYNIETATSSVINLALFNKVQEETTLKNVRVNLYNGGQLSLNVSKFKTINIAGFAIENAGVITNCEVVSFYSNESAVGEVYSDVACVLHNNPQGLNVNYVKANGTDNVYLPDNANWSSQIAGFVLDNTGSITNSRVGGEEIIVVGAEKMANGISTGYTYASTLKLDTFNISGQGNIAGFVLNNSSGYITSSFVKQVNIENQSNSTSFYTAGFAGTNNSTILTSYIEGTPSVEENMPAKEYSKFAFEGTSIRSTLGYVVGFIYENEGIVKDSYSNILISNSLDSTRVYYASGFVYNNEGRVENCYSASQIANSKFSQMNFSGVSESGNLLNSGEYINCYYFNKSYVENDDVNDSTTESQYNTGAQLITKPDEVSAYYGFAIADGENDGIWRTDENRGITLIEANKTTISNRYTSYIEGDFDGLTAEDAQGRKYVLLYSVLTFVDTAREIDTSLGGEYNPIVVYDAEDFIEISGTSQSTYVKQYFNDNVIWGSYRLVNNINLLDVASGEETVALPSSHKSFAGRLYGNGFTISGISISADAQSQNISYGLFKSIEPRMKSVPIITNLNLVISQVVGGDIVMVGGLAGYIKDAIINNIDIQFANDSTVTGLNFVGGLAGLASGNNIIKNIVVTNPTTIAERRADFNENDNYFASSNDLQLFRTKIKNNLNYNTTKESSFVTDLKKYSYAGSLIGFVDNYTVDNFEFNINQVSNYSINNIRVNGEINVQGQVVGGIIGITGYQTNVRDMGLTISGQSKILATKYFAGGAIGQSFGGVSRTFTVYEKSTQDIIEDNLSNFYNGKTNVERGQLDIFSAGTTNYTQKYIGGLIGYVGSGKIETSYSKLNVTSASADYAGGAIGGIEVSNATTYQTDTKKASESAYTKYFMHEIYATGDVRGKVYAGGVIGAIRGEGSRVALLAVNGLNYFTTYDYATGNYLTLDNTVKNMSNNIRANSLVGHMINSSDKIETIDETNYSKYLILMQAGESYTTETSYAVKTVPSIGYYEGYYLNNGQLVTTNLFGTLDGRVDFENKLYTKSIVFAVARPINNYIDSSIGHTYTKAGFIYSGAWLSENWEHNTEDLFPEIRYKRSYDVLYLDQYNIKQVFDAMDDGGNVTVVVRGKIDENSEACADIDLTGYFERNEISPINSFSGILQGGGGRIFDEELGMKRDVKIITDRSFIKSTAPGVSINNLTIDYYKDSSSEISVNNGLLTESLISEGAVSNVTLNIKNPIKVSQESINDQQGELNIGLIAPTIRSTIVTDVTINTDFSDQSKTTLLSIPKTNSSTLNVGLIAGSAIQDSTISKMKIENIQLDIVDSISLEAGSKNENEINIGTYFGNLQKTLEAQSIDITLNSLVNKAPTVDINGEDTRTKIIITNPSVKEVALEEVSPVINMGGYIGKSIGVERYIFNIERDIKTFVDFDYAYQNEKLSLNVGGIIGSADQFALNGADLSAGATVKAELNTNGKTVSNLNAGGIYGGTATGISTVGKISISNFNTIDFEVNGDENANSYRPNKVDLDGEYENYTTENGVGSVTYAKVLESANVGIIAGYSAGSFVMNGSTLLNSNGQSINVSANNSKIGSVLGFADDGASIKASINSLANFMLNNNTAEKTVVGGLIGFISNKDVVIENQENISIFQGGIFSNAKNLVFGGVIGCYTGNKSINISNTSFGGVVKIYGENSNSTVATTGGTVGQIDNTDTSVNIENNYNYGDVFVEYNDIFTSLATYNFGGIIGTTSILTDPLIKDNYSIVTSHNSKYSALNNTANALFGGGKPWSGTPVSTENYYNHAACLLADDFGKDMGYNSIYDTSKNLFGYGEDYVSYEDNTSTSTITSFIKSKLEVLNLEFNLGHKLKPDTINNLKNEGLSANFNGISYYTYDGVGEQITIGEEKITSIKNIAIIGQTTKEYTYSNITSLVYELSGYSSISGIAFNVEVNADITDDSVEMTFAPLVNTMKDNSIVYAVNIKGLYNLGGKSSVSLSGLVGNVESGKIFDSSTDLDITYRAGENGFVYALTNLTGQNAFVENCYTGGSITTMANADIYAFANSVVNSRINSSYTYTKLKPNNYLSEENYSGKIDTFGKQGSISNCSYDSNGLNYILPEGVLGTNVIGKRVFLINGVTNNAFNYGYPTHKYQYLKVSSYVKLEDTTYQCGHSSHSSDQNCYDCYIKTNTYSFYANGIEATSGTNVYYNVPNASVLFDSEINAQNMVLKYDIDLSRKTIDSSITEFKNIFDGQGKTIKGLSRTLFASIKDGTVDNLRLTDVTIKNAPALAYTLENANISNLTLSGLITMTSSGGAVANSISNSTISTTKNMIDISYSATKDVNLGGLFGNAENSNILYSSNYGPVRSYHSSGNGYEDYVGGLVGKIEGGSIQYSYNTASVLGNYANSTKLSTSTGTFYTGGLAGNIVSAIVSNSYNSGMIKSGNKTNTAKAYAGGIMGKAVESTISNVYNEGTIEALGKNPEWDIEYNKTSYSLVIKGDKSNVYAYSIGYLASSKQIGENVIGRVQEEVYELNANNQTIKNNGNFFGYEKDFVLKTWEIDDIYTEDIASQDYEFDKTAKVSYYDGELFDLVKIWLYKYTNQLKLTTNYSLNNTKEFMVTGFNEFGIPSRVIFPVTKTVTLTHIYTPEHLFAPEPTTKEYSFKVNEYGIGDYSFDENNFYGHSLSESKNVTNVSEGEAVTELTEKAKTIIDSTRSSFTSDKSVETVSIAGLSYAIANTNNNSTLFNKGIYIQTLEDVTFEGIKYIPNKNYYTLTVNNDILNCRLLSIEESSSGNGVTASIEVYTTNEGGMPANTSFNLKLDYQEKLEFNLSEMKYFAVNDYSFAIEMPKDFTPTPLENYTITDKIGNKYEEVVKLSEYDYNEIIDGVIEKEEPEDDTDTSFIYLAKDENGRYVYISYGQLSYNGVSTKVVNKHFMTEDSTFTYDNTKNVIDNLFNNKILYFRVENEKTEEVKMNFIDYSKSSTSITAGEERENEITLSYGKEIDLLIIGDVVFKQNVTENEPVEGEEPTYTVNSVEYSVGFAIDSSSVNENAIGLIGDTAVMSFVTSTNVLSTNSTVEINGFTYNMTQNSDSFVLHTTDTTAINQIDFIKSYFQSIKFITDDFTNSVTEEKQYTSSTRTITLTDDSDTRGTITVSKNQEWYWNGALLNLSSIESGALKVEKNGYNNLVLSLTGDRNKLTSYTYNGITVSKGTITTKIQEKYYTTLGSVVLYPPQTDSEEKLPTYIEIYAKDKNNTSETIKVLLNRNDKNTGSAIGYGFDNNKKYVGELELSITYFSTFRDKGISKNESGEYKLVLQSLSNESQYYTEIDTSSGDVEVTKLTKFIENNEGGIVELSKQDNMEIDAEGNETGETITSIYLNDREMLRIKNNQYSWLKETTDDEGNSVYAFTEYSDRDSISDKIVDFDSDTLLEFYSEKIKFEKYTSDEQTYYFVRDYKVIDSVSYKYEIQEKDENGNIVGTEEIEVIYNNLAVINIFDWEQTNAPAYDFVSQNAKYSGLTIKNQDSIQEKIYQNHPTYTIYLRKDNKYLTLDLVLNNQINNLSVDLDPSLKVETYQAIILEKDISFNYNSKLITNSINLIGNGYSISFIGSLYDTLTNNKYIKEVLFLGESYNEAFLTNKASTKSTGDVDSKYINLSFYGTVNNLKDKSIAIMHTKGSLNNSKSFVSVSTEYNSIGEFATDGINLFNQATLDDEFKNYGTIIALDGKIGANGNNGKSATKGSAGTNGQSIYVSDKLTEGEKVTNIGVVKVGQGNVGGAGGSYTNDSSRYNGGVGKEGQEAGESGTKGIVSQFDTSVSVSELKYSKNFSGATSRNAVFHDEAGTGSWKSLTTSSIQLRYDNLITLVLEKNNYIKKQYFTYPGINTDIIKIENYKNLSETLDKGSGNLITNYFNACITSEYSLGATGTITSNTTYTLPKAS